MVRGREEGKKKDGLREGRRAEKGEILEPFNSSNISCF